MPSQLAHTIVKKKIDKHPVYIYIYISFLTAQIKTVLFFCFNHCDGIIHVYLLLYHSTEPSTNRTIQVLGLQLPESQKINREDVRVDI